VHHLDDHATSSELTGHIISPSISDLCSDDISILHRFRSITTFTVYLTACDLEKSLNFNKIVDIAGQVCCTIHIIVNTCYVSGAMIVGLKQQ